MKKTLLLVAALMVGASTFAQSKYELSTVSLAANPAHVVAPSVNKAPMKADLKENEVLVGVYTTDDYDKDAGLGFGSAITCEPATEIPASCYSSIGDLQITGLRFALCSEAKINSVQFYKLNPDGSIEGEPLATHTVNKRCPAGWNTFEFDAPVPVDNSWGGVVASYSVSLGASDYPMATNSKVNGELLVYGNLGPNGDGWYTMGSGYGAPAIQLIGTCAPVSGYSVVPSYFNYTTAACNNDFVVEVVLACNSEGVVNDIEYTVELDGKSETRNVSFSPAIEAGYGQNDSFKCSLVAPEKPGTYPVNFTVTKINGTEVEAPVTKHFNLPVIARIVPRYTIVEEYTGTGCGFCPLGWVGMGYVKEHMSDMAGVIAIHQYNSSDPMFTAAYHSPKFSGAPQCSINRVTTDIPPYAEYMEEYIPQFAEFLPEVEVKVNATFSENLATVNCEATTEFLADLPGSELVFVLTGDGLTSPATSWKQANYLYSAAQNSGSYPASVNDFCLGGKYGQSSVSLVFDDVLLTSSWPSASAKNKVAAFTTTDAGEFQTSTVSLTLPTKSTLKPFLVYDKMNVTAMVLKADGSIANAARCHVSYPEGINTVLAPAADDATTYDLSGRVAPVTAKGLLIEGGKKVIR